MHKFKEDTVEYKIDMENLYWWLTVSLRFVLLEVGEWWVIAI